MVVGCSEAISVQGKERFHTLFHWHYIQNTRRLMTLLYYFTHDYFLPTLQFVVIGSMELFITLD